MDTNNSLEGFILATLLFVCVAFPGSIIIKSSEGTSMALSFIRPSHSTDISASGLESTAGCEWATD